MVFYCSMISNQKRFLTFLFFRKEDLSKLKSAKDLPENAIAYIERIEELCGVPVRWIGIGPGRDQTVEFKPERFQ